MSITKLLKRLHEKNLSLSTSEGRLLLRGEEPFVDDPALVSLVREHKEALIELIQSGNYVLPGKGDRVPPPPNRIPSQPQTITPEMLPLVTLNLQQIETLIAQVQGGVGNIQDIYSLTPLQEGILFHRLTANEGDPYLLSGSVAFERRQDLDAALRAIQLAVDRHDIFRTAIFWEELPEPVQVVLRTAVLPVEEISLGVTACDAVRNLHSRFDTRHFMLDLHQAPLLRVIVTYDAVGRRWLLLLLLHHLAGDHATLKIFQEEIEAYLQGRPEDVPEPSPFRNFVFETKVSVGNNKHEEYFRRMLGHVDESTLPFGLIELRESGSEIREAALDLPSELALRIRRQARKDGVSTATLCHLAWAEVLARVCGKKEVVYGTVLFGRMNVSEHTARVMGPCINTLPVCIRIDEQDVLSAARRTHELLAELVQHEHASLALAQRCSAVPGATPLFSSILNYRHSTFAPSDVTKSRLLWVGSGERTNYPLTLSVDDLGAGFRLAAHVLESVDPLRVCQMMQEALGSLVTALEEAPATPLNTLEVLPRSEVRTVLYDWNDTAAPFPGDICVHQMFEDQVLRSPAATALVFEEQSLSFEQLNHRANQLAHHLRDLGVRPDDRIALCLDRSVEMVVALFAVWKAGAAYVPLDPDSPRERLDFLLDDAAPAVLLTQAHLAGQFAPACPLLTLDAESLPWAHQPTTNPLPSVIGVAPHHLAYIIYTSGSTGTPKGVMVEHRSVVNRIVWMQATYCLNQDDAVLQKTPYTFDVSVWEFVWPLVTGTRLVIAQPEGHKDPTYLRQLIQRHQISTLHFVPSMLQVFLTQEVAGECSCLRRVICSGEALPATLVRSFQQLLPATTLYNLYGPTEATVDVTAFVCPPQFNQESVPIGRPIANTAIYVLDEQQRPAPIGVAGEIYIGGAGVARGYLNRPELTAERFLPDPFNSQGAARMYRTGDLGCWLPDGNIEYFGRNDFQVKIRGFRIELGEIEARLAEHPAIAQTVVLTREDRPGDKRLVAYYVPSPGSSHVPEFETLRLHLSRSLPEYMVPSVFMSLDALPITPNGKLDRKALPAPDATNIPHTSQYQAPQGEVEELISQIWARVLEVDRIGRHDNFFELGGHSLLAVKVIEHLRRHGMHADIRALFNAPTLTDFTSAIHNGAPEIEVPPNLIPTAADNQKPSPDEVELHI
jgi:amino acid adenylation domain-containing protein